LVRSSSTGVQFWSEAATTVAGMLRIAFTAACALAVSSCAAPPIRLDSLHLRCRSRAGLPDRHCTPGAIDHRVTQANIHQTICVPGYTARVRPPLAYTTAIKRIELVEYRFYAGQRLADYELDHLLPLELGGAARDTRNLWPQARAGTGASATKDEEENLLHRRVCDGGESLAAARSAMATDWLAAYRRDIGGGRP